MPKTTEDLVSLMETLKKHFEAEFGGWDSALIQPVLSQMLGERRNAFVRVRTDHLDSLSLIELMKILGKPKIEPIVVEESNAPKKRGRPKLP